MLRKVFSLCLIGLTLFVGIGLAVAFVGAANPDGYTGQSWLGNHTAGDMYPLHFRIERTHWYTRTLYVKVYGFDLSGVTCGNNWDNQVTISGSIPDYTITVTGTHLTYTGLSAEVDCGYVPVSADYAGLTKVGYGYEEPGVITATVSYVSNNPTAYLFPGSWQTAEANIRIDSGTQFIVNVTNTTMKAYIGDYELGVSCSAGTCTISAPKGAKFEEIGHNVTLYFVVVDPTIPFGLVLPAPTPTPTPTP